MDHAHAHARVKEGAQQLLALLQDCVQAIDVASGALQAAGA